MVHIREYRDKPTKNGIAISPYVWEVLRNKMCAFTSTKRVNRRFFVGEDLIVNYATACVSVQRLFKTDGLFQCSETALKIALCAFERLQDESLQLNVSRCVQKMLSSELVRKILPKKETAKYVSDKELMEIYAKTVSEHLYNSISEIYDCTGCRMNYLNQLGHDCINLRELEVYSEYFSRAFARIDFCEVAKIFSDISVNDDFFVKMKFEEFENAIQKHYLCEIK